MPQPDRFHQMTDDAGLRRQQHIQHADQHDYRDEVRQIDGRLHELLHFFAPNLVENQRQNDGSRKTEHNARQADQKGVPHQVGEQITVDELLKIRQSPPFAPSQPFAEVIVAKSELNPVHRNVIENQNNDDCREDHDPELIIARDGVN